MCLKEIFNSTDVVMLSRVESLLNDNEIGFVRLDQHTSGLFAGFLDLIPQRIMVRDNDHNDAARVLRMEQIKPSSDAEGDRFRKDLRPW